MLLADEAHDIVVGSVDRLHAVVVDHVVDARPVRGVGVGPAMCVEVQRRAAIGVSADATAAVEVVDGVLPACVICDV